MRRRDFLKAMPLAVAAYTHGFAMMENPPMVDAEGYLNLPQGPGLGVEINKALIAP